MVVYTKKIYHENIEKITNKNINYRKVLYTVPGSIQLVVQNLQPTEFIPREVHDFSQFIRIESGDGEITVEYPEKKVSKLQKDDAIIVPAGIYHKIVNTGDEPLKFYIIYESQEHQSDLVQ